MFEADLYLKMALDYIHRNPISIGILFGLLKWVAMRTETTEDDKILTMVRNFIKPKGLTVTGGDNPANKKEDL